MNRGPSPEMRALFSQDSLSCRNSAAPLTVSRLSKSDFAIFVSPCSAAEQFAWAFREIDRRPSDQKDQESEKPKKFRKDRLPWDRIDWELGRGLISGLMRAW
jgi:hypothetical protein